MMLFPAKDWLAAVRAKLANREPMSTQLALAAWAVVFGAVPGS